MLCTSISRHPRVRVPGGRYQEGGTRETPDKHAGDRRDAPRQHEEAVEEALEWHQSGGSAGQLGVEAGSKKKWAADNAERLVM